MSQNFRIAVLSGDGIGPEVRAAAVEDVSCRIDMDGLSEVVAAPFATQVRSPNAFFSIFEGIGAQFSSFGSWVSRGFKPVWQDTFKNMNVDSQFSAIRGIDSLLLNNGVIFARTGFDRAVVIGPSRLVAAGGGNMVAAGGGN